MCHKNTFVGLVYSGISVFLKSTIISMIHGWKAMNMINKNCLAPSCKANQIGEVRRSITREKYSPRKCAVLRKRQVGKEIKEQTQFLPIRKSG